jgi:hypothetical protein
VPTVWYIFFGNQLLRAFAVPGLGARAGVPPRLYSFNLIRLVVAANSTTGNQLRRDLPLKTLTAALVEEPAEEQKQIFGRCPNNCRTATAIRVSSIEKNTRQERSRDVAVCSSYRLVDLELAVIDFQNMVCCEQSIQTSIWCRNGVALIGVS